MITQNPTTVQLLTIAALLGTTPNALRAQYNSKTAREQQHMNDIELPLFIRKECVSTARD